MKPMERATCVAGGVEDRFHMEIIRLPGWSCASGQPLFILR